MVHLFRNCFAMLFFSAAWAQSPAGVEAVVETDLGTFRMEFAPDKAPRHVEQFLKLARQGYYDGSAFHRVIANGIIQGGDPLLKVPGTRRELWGTGGLNLLAGEISDLKHERGVVSTVRIPGKPGSDGSQFFVCVSAQASLDGQFSAFGRVLEGMQVVEKISQTPVDANGLAVTPIRIRHITVEPKPTEPYLNTPVEELRKSVTLKTTLGTIRILMEPGWAPLNVRNFLKLTSIGYYMQRSFTGCPKGSSCKAGWATV